jgi:deoxycytidine triphosphate deaminase
MILSDRTIREALAAGRIEIDPLDARDIQPSSVDLHIDRYFRVFRNHTMRVIDVKEDQEELTELVEASDDDPFILHPGEFVLGSTRERVRLPDDLVARLEGKALAVDTEVPTPSGWRTMIDLRPGDLVFHPSGQPVMVVAATDVMTDRRCYEVEFSDGRTVIADAAHQWATQTRRLRRNGLPARVFTTEQIAATLTRGSEYNHHVAISAPVDYPTIPLPVDPYVLGAWLGDGSVSPQRRGLEHVPDLYLTAGIEQRLLLLQGLMDADGCVDERGRCEFRSANEGLADAVAELAASLGLRPVKRKRRAMLNGIDCGPGYQVKFTPHLPVFRLPRKLARQKAVGGFQRFRSIVAVRPCERMPVRCIQVAAPDGMFLITRSFIPTHNSSLGRLGLLIHSTAGFVDAGWDGQLTLELSNVANLPITLYPGMKIGQISFLQMTTPAEHPYGSREVGSKYQHQIGPRPSRYFENFRRDNRSEHS